MTKSVDITQDITWEYIARLRYHEDSLGIVLKGHLLTEYIINQMIRKRCKRAATIIDDHRTYTYSVKARLLLEMEILPEYLYTNIVRINSARNNFAHKLNFDTGRLDFLFDHSDPKKGRINLRPNSLRHRDPARYYLRMLCHATLSQLQVRFQSLFGTVPLADAPVESVNRVVKPRRGRSRTANQSTKR